MTRSKILVSWSTGKDSAWMVHLLRQNGAFSLGGLLTSINESVHRVSMHGVRVELLEAQAAALGLPLWPVPLPDPCSHDEYARRFSDIVGRAVAEGFTHVAFGDLFLEDVRAYREERLRGTGLKPVFPLWLRPTEQLARDMLRGGLQATLTCVDPAQLDRAFVGRSFDAGLLDELPPDVDPCGERGEFHTFAHAGPMFERPIAVRTGPTVERGGFVFADMAPATPS